MVDRERTYTPDEVTAIVSGALQRRGECGSIAFEELKEIGAELGIPPQDLADSARHLATKRDMERARKTWLQRQRLDLRHHVTSYLIVNGFLFLMNIFSPPITYGLCGLCWDEESDWRSRRARRCFRIRWRWTRARARSWRASASAAWSLPRSSATRA